MARVNLTNSPYYDDYDESKQYVQFLAIPGRVAQSREFTSLQTTLRGIIKSVGDSILRNGDIVEGCQVLVSGNTVTVTSGKVYVEGIVMPVTESSVAISGSGTETIGVKLMEVIVDESIDNTLRDPAQGYDNYNQPGCNRLKRYLSVVANDPEAITISTLIDGSVMVESYAPEYDTLSQTLARRTYDESGSYLVEGLKVRTESLNNTQYNVVIESGKAYILGYELKIPTARRIVVDRSTTHSSVSASNYVFDEDVSSYLLDSDPYVKSINTVNGRVSTTESQTISSNLDSILLDQVDVVRVTSVAQGGTNYTVGATSESGDCYLLRDGTRYYLKWRGTANYPSLGSTYNVTYEYTKDFTETTDYTLTLVNGSHYLNWTNGGSSPLDGTSFSVNYDQYLARKDLVYIDRYGAIEVLKGVPAEYGFEVLPEPPLNTLVLANISNPPNGTVEATTSSDAIEVSNIGLTRFTMNDIQSILNRLRTVEYDQAVISLNDDARQIDTVNDKKGIFTDPLIDISRIDFYYNLLEGAVVDNTKPNYDMALDLLNNLCYLPVVSHTSTPAYNTETSTTHKYSRLISLATTGERAILSQTNATKSFLVNPYSMFPQMPEVSVDPSVDNWIEDTIIEIPVSISSSEIVSLSSRVIDTRGSSQRNSNWRVNSRTSTSTTAIGTRTDSYTTESVVSENAITYIRPRTITIEGSDFPANLDNIQCYFDGVLVSLTPAIGTLAGTISGSVRANALGYVKATFVIPNNILTGVREVLLKSSITIDGYITEGFTLYIAEGIARRIERTVTTVNTVLLNRVTTTTITATYVDPVGQTFVLDRMSLIKGIDVYFENKPTTNTPIVCEIREVTNGTITSTVYAHKSLNSVSVNTSANAGTATRFNFDDPVLLEENKEYAFILRSMSDDYRVWVSELGGTDVLTGDLVLKNSYMTGVMMSSSNNSTWTNHQTMDMKFRLVEDIYASNSVINFNQIDVTDAARLYLTADSAIPSETSIDWLYSLDGTNYKSITPYNLVLLNGTYNTINLRANLNKSNTSNLSPLLALDTVYLTDSHYDMSGAYVSKNISGLDAYTNVKLVIDTYKPAGTSFTFKISKDNGTTFTTMTEVGTGTTLNYGWKEQTYTATVASSTQCKIFIEATSSTKYSTPSFRRLRAIMS